MSEQTSYPVGHQFSIGFNPIEDRLLLTTELKEAGTTTLLLTRRMVLLVLKQILDRLPALSGLDQTPANYWQEVLELSHQQAVQQHQQEADRGRAQDTCAKAESSSNESTEPARAGEQRYADISASRVFLATELNAQQARDRLQLAFKGLPMPESMLKNGQQVPVLALSLEATHAHQVLQSLIAQATKANWNLPVNLPWTNVKASRQTARISTH
ncbi:hypothetical protein MLC59_01170 [Marinobacter bryozoorum]|uniref:hypothetical protein n=1 Tax=Marinobacter bryozoorum TaxID=256324 RepID=UPI0020055C87|nr:hypothetical protein [Marinobacter bryozoorum]MCK7542780.1 hypothetical protein [Marinobacter bryozoorum]